MRFSEAEFHELIPAIEARNWYNHYRERGYTQAAAVEELATLFWIRPKVVEAWLNYLGIIAEGDNGNKDAPSPANYATFSIV